MLAFQNTVHCFSKTSMIVTLSVSEHTICGTPINCVHAFLHEIHRCSLQFYSLRVEVTHTCGKKCGVDCVVKKRTKTIFDQRTILPEKSMNLSLFFAFRDTFLPLKIVNLHTLAVACTHPPVLKNKMGLEWILVCGYCVWLQPPITMHFLVDICSKS